MSDVTTRVSNATPTAQTLANPENTQQESQTMTDIIELTVTNGIPTTTSLVIAERFGKQHKHVLRDIEKLAAQNEGAQSNFGCGPFKNKGDEPNFGPVSPKFGAVPLKSEDVKSKSEFEEFAALNFQGSAYRGGNGELRPMYRITKDGFMFLAMGFTGKEAAAWKVRFIAAFNAMERQLLENAAAQQIPQPTGQLFLSHTADIIVAADRTFRAGVRSGRLAGLSTAQSIRRANKLAYLKTGINMLEELDATDHLTNLETKEAQAKPADQDVGGLQDFWGELENDGFDGVGYNPWLSTQLHQLYVYWCLRNNIVALNMPRLVHGLKAAGWVRSVRKRYVDEFGGTHGPCGFLFPTGPNDILPGVSETQWLGECVAKMDLALQQLKA